MTFKAPNFCVTSAACGVVDTNQKSKPNRNCLNGLEGLRDRSRHQTSKVRLKQESKVGGVTRLFDYWAIIFFGSFLENDRQNDRGSLYFLAMYLGISTVILVH
jgi:hypothetical protein